MDSNLVNEMAKQLAFEINYQKFDENNVNHITIRDRILEENGLIEDETIAEIQETVEFDVIDPEIFDELESQLSSNKI